LQAVTIKFYVSMNVNNRSAIQLSAAPWWPGMMPAHKQTMENLLQRSHRPDPATQRCKAAKIILRRHIIAYAERVRRTNSRQENSIQPTQNAPAIKIAKCVLVRCFTHIHICGVLSARPLANTQVAYLSAPVVRNSPCLA
jgi:hypothetical protein